MALPSIPQIFDPAQRRRARERALTMKGDFFLHDWAASNMQERLQDIKRTFSAPFSLDIHTGDLGEREILPVQESVYDLITSNLYLHTLNDPLGLLIQIRRALKPDGLFIGTMLGGETLHELRQALTQAEMELRGGLSPRVAPFADKQQMGALMQRAGYALPVIDSELVTVTYTNFYKLLHDLRAMGETNMLAARPKAFTPRRLFERAAEIYKDHFSESDGTLRATFDIIFLLGWAPHDSQQKPLKPGSAQINLGDIL